MFGEWPGRIQTLEPESLGSKPSPDLLSCVVLGSSPPSLGTGTAICAMKGCHSSFREDLAGRLTCTSHFTLLEPHFPSPKMNHLSLESNEGSQGTGGREQGGKGTKGGGTRGRSEAPAVYLLFFEQSIRSHEDPLASSPPHGWGCLPEGMMEP